MNISSVIKINSIEKKYRGFKLSLSDVEIPKGFATALIGENGAGKSTLINILAGIRLDYKGSVEFFNNDYTEAQIREHIGYTGPGNYFMPHWKISQVEEASSILFDGFDRTKFKKICNELGIMSGDTDRNNKSISNLSDGMRMKLMLSAVFARDTNLLILDEPASPLDPIMRDRLCNMISEYIEEGDGERSVFFSTHNIADMESVTDYVILMENGKVVERGFVEDLKEQYVLVKGEASDYDKVKGNLLGAHKSAYGFEGICQSDRLEAFTGMDVVVETATLSQICVAIMKKYSNIG